jgi:hypothetical protein
LQTWRKCKILHRSNNTEDAHIVPGDNLNEGAALASLNAAAQQIISNQLSWMKNRNARLPPSMSRMSLSMRAEWILQMQTIRKTQILNLPISNMKDVEKDKESIISGSRDEHQRGEHHKHEGHGGKLDSEHHDDYTGYHRWLRGRVNQAPFGASNMMVGVAFWRRLPTLTRIRIN